MALKSPVADSKNLSSMSIKRTAIDPAGCIGSFYDGYRDILCGKFDLTIEDKLVKSLKTSQCMLKSSSKSQDENFLEVINMPDEQCLSVLLGSAGKNNIASIIDYHHSINEYTRFLHYTYINQEEQMSDKLNRIQKKIRSSNLSAATTHIVTAISYGIDIVVVLRLPTADDVASKADDILRRICTNLNDGQSMLKLHSNEENILRQISDVLVYSNTPSLMELSTMHDIYSYINQNKDECKSYPIHYTLQPIRFLFPEYSQPNVNFGSIPLEITSEIETFLIHLMNTVNQIKYCLDSFTTELQCRNLEDPLHEKQCQWLTLDDMRKHIFDRIQRWIIDMRKKRSGISKTIRLFDHTDYIKFDKYARSLQEAIDDLKMKENLIISLRKQHFDYCNVTELHLNPDDVKTGLRQKLTIEGRDNRILCTNDALNEQNREKLDRLQNQLIEERKKNKNLHLTYADFTYSNIDLDDMEILTANGANTNENINTKKASSSKFDPNINILLLGEIGVGKSTFINALVNYLKFKKIEQAQLNKPVVLIPVSFLITTGKNSKEHRIKYGDFESSNNEDYDHSGESVTQHCKTYEFNLTDYNGQKLCIIDTPGFGDTRGLDQDNQNLQNILEYISNLTHLNAVCFFLKPNSSKMHSFFDMCCTQLLDLLSPRASQNIIFCFTNTRPSSYTSGDTGHLINISLQSFSNSDIPFNKGNTFCFDNEAFRYSVALLNKIQFNDDDINDYEKSWSISVEESNRLIKYILQNLTACRLNTDWKSIKRAQIEITRLIRPMLETIQNTLRNIILAKIKKMNSSIKVFPKAIHRPASICLSCKPYPLQVGNFWIARDIPHEFFLKKCLVCACTIDRHMSIHYLLDYEYSNTSISDHQEEMVKTVNQLCVAGAQFDYFLVHIARSSKEYIFLFGLLRIIDVENKVCLCQTPKNMNSHLVEELIQLKCQYENRIEQLKSGHKSTDLLIIDKWITSIRKYPLIRAQLETMKKSQALMTELCEL